VEAFFLAFGVVFVAELGDKTQLVALSLATRHRLVTVLVGITIAYAITNGISVIIGGLLGAAFPTTVIAIVGGVLFLGFAVWTFLGSDDDDDVAGIAGRSAFVSIVLAMVVAELGDKTMLATATLAAREAPLATWLGATLGITASGALAVMVGRALGTRLPRRATRLTASALFALFGVLLIIDAVAR
jgi:putative Ca2+/H+ antiporter (TMEM165/GDT1 family)